MDLFYLIHPYLRSLSSWFPFIVGVLSIRIMISSFMSPTQNKRVVLLASLAVASCALLFNKEIFAFWNLIMISGFLLVSATFSKIRPNIQNKILSAIFTILISIGVLGVYSGYALVFTTGPSMWPTSSKSLSADILNITAYQIDKVDYGDDVHFSVPSSSSSWPSGNFRKRIWGLPGDEIKISNHEIHINGLLVANCSDRANRIDQNIWYCEAVFPNGKQTNITWGVVNIFNESQAKFKLGDNEVFVMGDNTVESTDSRYWGAITNNWIEGRFDNAPKNPKEREWKAY